jgi:hypothetical protein
MERRLEKFPLWVMKVSRLLELYDGKAGAVLEPHLVLKARKDIVRIPRGTEAKIVFVSHEWYDYNHPDPTGLQLKHLCAVRYTNISKRTCISHTNPLNTQILKRLGNGEIRNVTTDWRTRIWVTSASTTTAEELKVLCDPKDCYVWIDYVSMPQPTAVLMGSSDKKLTQTKRRALLSATDQLTLAAESMEAYIRACNFMLILAPDVYLDNVHFSRQGKPQLPSYFSWRTRGWCMLELVACVLSVEPKRVLVVRNGMRGKPSWYCSAAATFGVQVGLRDFTCCMCNHTFSKRGM